MVSGWLAEKEGREGVREEWERGSEGGVGREGGREGAAVQIAKAWVGRRRKRKREEGRKKKWFCLLQQQRGPQPRRRQRLRLRRQRQPQQHRPSLV